MVRCDSESTFKLQNEISKRDHLNVSEIGTACIVSQTLLKLLRCKCMPKHVASNTVENAARVRAVDISIKQSINQRMPKT